MTPKLENFLFKTYPKLFPRGRDVNPKSSLMCFGMENGDGWFDLIHNLCATIQAYISMRRVSQVVVDQVKEKYGTLRFYYHGGDDIVEGMVTFAEFLSGITCEACGNTDRETIGRTNARWFKTCCRGCIPKLLTDSPSVYKWKSHRASAKSYARKKASQVKKA